MITFYLAAAALVVVALVLLLRPWWRLGRDTGTADTLLALNAAIHRDRLAELERDRNNGTLSADDFAEAREELQRQLLDDTAATEVAVAATASRKGGIAIAILLPADCGRTVCPAGQSGGGAFRYGAKPARHGGHGTASRQAGEQTGAEPGQSRGLGDAGAVLYLHGALG
jgi:cytochrome c-type biogenesis protein CcmI